MREFLNTSSNIKYIIFIDDNMDNALNMYTTFVGLEDYHKSVNKQFEMHSFWYEPAVKSENINEKTRKSFEKYVSNVVQHKFTRNKQTLRKNSAIYLHVEHIVRHHIEYVNPNSLFFQRRLLVPSAWATVKIESKEDPAKLITSPKSFRQTKSLEDYHKSVNKQFEMHSFWYEPAVKSENINEKTKKSFEKYVSNVVQHKFIRNSSCELAHSTTKAETEFGEAEARAVVEERAVEERAVETRAAESERWRSERWSEYGVIPYFL